MNRSLFAFLISLALLAGTAVAHAQGKQIYTWTDENGVVHYVDTPPDNPNAVQVDAPEAYRPGSSTTVAVEDDTGELTEGSAEVPSEGEEPVSYADQKRQEMADRSSERRARQAERDANCKKAEQQLATIEPHRRVFFTNEDGEVERMDDEKRVQQVEDLKAYIAENCE